MSEATLSDEYFVDDVLEELFANVSIDEEDTGDSTGEIQKKSLNNPLKIPLDGLHIERSVLERNKDFPDSSKDGSFNFKKCFRRRTEIIPALDARWLTERELHFYYQYQPYYPQFSKEDNYLFKENNLKFCETLEDLLKYDFQTFWCVLLFAPEAGIVLKEFISEPVYIFDYDCLSEEEMDIYVRIVINGLHVYQRMLRFKESEAEYLTEETGINFLISKQHLTTPIIMKLAMLYNSVDENFVKKVVRMYYTPKYKSVYVKELRETLLFIKNLLEALESILSDAETPILEVQGVNLRKKSIDFDPHWAQEIVAHLVECFFSLSSFLPLLDEAVEIAIELKLPKLIPMVYHNAFEAIETYMTDRASVNDELRFNIHNYVRVGRNEGVKCFDAIVSYCIRKVVDLANSEADQEGLVEMYLEWIQESLEYDIFINDYNLYSTISLQIDQISSFYPKIEKLRVKYIKASIDTILARLNNQESVQVKRQKLKSCKLSDLWNNIWKDVIADPPPYLNFAALEQKEGQSLLDKGETPSTNKGVPSEEIEEKIRTIMDTLPHLGDGFILQCLEHYQYNVNDTLSAILDQNLPPHLTEIPFDTIRIPEETEHEEKPLLGYKGKRNQHTDAMQLLNDKTGIKDIKELIIINSMVKEDPNDDEFDDRTLDDEPIPLDSDHEERVLRHLQGAMKNLVVVSDPSDESSDEEQDEALARKRNDFCEDPAVLRARREAQRKGNGKGRNFDVIGKPKGQGQEKDVQHNRDKKNVNKSSRANHNRKKGAQWKRSRGMMPS